MFFNLINLVKGLLFFTGSYSNNVFLEPLTPEEEDKYVRLMLEGNTSARNKLIEHNLRLVAHIVKKYTNNNNDMTDDLISIGTIGLIKGIDTYKNNKKTKITTYAARCIQNEILMHFRGVRFMKYKGEKIPLKELIIGVHKLTLHRIPWTSFSCLI